jgi:galacturan 1,4-alpha-galacturonidase
MSNAQNGARIKAWAGKGVGSGIVKNITFSFFTETSVDNPVVIDQVSQSTLVSISTLTRSQCYETDSDDCEKYPSNTYIQDVWFNGCGAT